MFHRQFFPLRIFMIQKKQSPVNNKILRNRKEKGPFIINDMPCSVFSHKNIRKNQINIRNLTAYGMTQSIFLRNAAKDAAKCFRHFKWYITAVSALTSNDLHHFIQYFKNRVYLPCAYRLRNLFLQRFGMQKFKLRIYGSIRIGCGAAAVKL